MSALINLFTQHGFKELFASSLMVFTLLGGAQVSLAADRFVSSFPTGQLFLPSGDLNLCRVQKTPCPEIGWAASIADPGDTIYVDPSQTLHEHSVVINKEISIIGQKSTDVSIQAQMNADGLGRHFDVEPTGALTIENLRLLGGESTRGGAIRNKGTVEILVSKLDGNHASEFGGAIDNQGTLTVRNSQLLDNVADLEGGAIHNSGTAKLVNSNLTSNRTLRWGGAIYNNSELNVSYTTILSNASEQHGGGIYNDEGGEVILSTSTLDDNEALKGGAIYAKTNSRVVRTKDTSLANNRANQGGGIYLGGTTLVIFPDTEFIGNTATAEGGAIYSTGGNVTIVETDFMSNKGANGGAVFNVGGSVTVDLSVLSLNSATSGGGAIANVNNGDLSVRRSTFGANLLGFSPGHHNPTGPNAAGSGGAIFDTGSTTVIYSSTFAGNTTSSDGGAIFYGSENGQMDIVNSTFSVNVSESRGGAIFNGSSTGGGSVDILHTTFFGNLDATGATLFTDQSLRFDNSIISNSAPLAPTGSPSGACAGSGLPLLGSTNLIGIPSVDLLDESCSTVLTFNLGPAFGLMPRARNGGPTETHDNGGGAALGKIGNCTLSVDQRGATRPAGPDNKCDIGSFETQ